MNELHQKVVNAVFQMQKGCALKDFLTDAEIEESLSSFADILVCLGIPVDNE